MTTDQESGLCACTHDFEDHADHGEGHCRGVDSYEQPCECPSFVDFTTTMVDAEDD